MTPEEIWKPVFGCDAYEVSDIGNVRRVRNGRTVKPYVGRWGYLYVHLVGHHRRINRLVLESFVGAAPSPKHVAAHLDGTNTNNRLTNLAWVTAKENAEHRRLHGRTACGELQGQARLTTDQVRSIRERAAAGEMLRILAREAGVHEATVALVVHRETWAHV
jgi:HNH endonuclease/NUMOD4 motif